MEQEKVNEDVQKLTKAKFSYEFFGKSIVDQSEYGDTGYVMKDFHKKWVDVLEDAVDAEEARKVAITAFTGSSKTETLGVLYPLWKMFSEPGFEVLITSNNMNHSKEILSRIKFHIENSEYLEDYKDEAEHTWAQKEIELTNGSKAEVRALYDGVKGAHVDYVFCDEAAEYEDKELFSRYVETRIRRKDGVICLGSTPVHENDLMQKVGEGEKEDNSNVSQEGYWNGTYPVEEKIDEDKAQEMDDVYQNKNGDWVRPTFPEAFDRNDIETLREENPVTFQKEYLCQPLAVEGDMFDPNDVIECFDESQKLNQSVREDARYVMGCDFAISTKGDYSVFLVLEMAPDINGKKIKYIERPRGLPLDEQERRIKDLHSVFDFDDIIVDETNFGGSVYQNLMQDGLPVTGQDFSYKSRNNLLMNLKSEIESGDIIIPRGDNTSSRTRELTDTLYNELMGFGPSETQTGQVSYTSTASHDDLPIALSMALQGVKDKKKVQTYFAT
jgi:hypothetical protein